jgi:hypothetical protein
MADQKITKPSEAKPIPSDREGLLRSFVNQSSELAEKATTTTINIVRDVRSEINQGVGATINWVEGSQQTAFKLLRRVNERIDRLSDEAIDTVENVLLGVIRATRDTSASVTDLAQNLTKPHQSSVRAA